MSSSIPATERSSEDRQLGEELVERARNEEVPFCSDGDRAVIARDLTCAIHLPV